MTVTAHVADLSSWFSGGMPLPHAALLNGISNVVSLRSKKEMVRTYAERCVAAMTDDHSGWNRAEVFFVAPTMGCNYATLPHAEMTVPILAAYGCSPQPATLSLVDLRPETRSNRPSTLESCHAPNIQRAIT
jgi:hypothetical protein